MITRTINNNGGNNYYQQASNLDTSLDNSRVAFNQSGNDSVLDNSFNMGNTTQPSISRVSPISNQGNMNRGPAIQNYPSFQQNNMNQMNMNNSVGQFQNKQNNINTQVVPQINTNSQYGAYSGNNQPNLINAKEPEVIQGKPLGKAQNQIARQSTGARKSGLELLRDMQRMFVKQKMELLEMLTGCETENRYLVYNADERMQMVGDSIFKCKEKSTFMARNCLSGDCRPFTMRILHQTHDEDGEEQHHIDDEAHLFLLLNRPCKCTCCCCNRPEIAVTLKEGGVDKYIGKVVAQWACCDMLFDIVDRDDQVVYKINGTCCQWGLFCNCPCDKCAKIDFHIRLASGEPVGDIYKIYQQVNKEMSSDTDSFCCIFPEQATPEHKALLLATVLFIDFRYFEVSPQQNNVV